MADVQNFKKLFEAYFRKSLEKEFDVWYQFISDCEEPVLQEALDTLEECYAAKKNGGFRVDAPTFPEVKREYWAKKKYSASGGSQQFCNPECEQCGGIGQVWVVAEKQDGKITRFLSPGKPEAVPEVNLGIYDRECSFSFRIAHNHRGRWYGWSFKKHVIADVRMFVAVCDAMYKKQQQELKNA